MVSNSFNEFQRRLNLARNGGGILFCGAGFSADCLNFNPDETLGTGAQLLNLFNLELGQKPPYKDLQNAADALRDKIADNGMMKLLKERFTVSNVTNDMVDLLSTTLAEVRVLRLAGSNRTEGIARAVVATDDQGWLVELQAGWAEVAGRSLFFFHPA